jgi:phosphoenolpyruvate carboxylase
MNENIQAFEEHVALRFQVFNSIFLTLDLGDVHRTGILVPMLAELCRKGLAEGQSPENIMEQFFASQPQLVDQTDKINQLFAFVQFIERQVVLVDALEDAAFARVNNLEGSGSLKSFIQTAINRNARERLIEALDQFRVRVVLTAHPTQFYPSAVLGIITDLTEAVKQNNLSLIKQYLAQLARTPFFQKEKPTPYDEAIRLSWYLENIFYHAIPIIYRKVHDDLGHEAAQRLIENPLIQLGFWPGGDRDGNPFVLAETTVRVADELRTRVLKCYYRDVRALKRRITFRGAAEHVAELEKLLYQSAFENPAKPVIDLPALKNRLQTLRNVLDQNHQGLFSEEVAELQHKVRIFGFHFSTIDIRQDSRVISSSFDQLCTAMGMEVPRGGWDLDTLFGFRQMKPETMPQDATVRDTYESVAAIKTIQKRNGGRGCYRYIISNCRGEEDVARVYALARMAGLGRRMLIDIVPLFETINDLKHAGDVMHRLYSHPEYKRHLRVRNMKQVVMLGFSDGTKDGGYISANWNIFKAKEEVSRVSREHGIQVVFFDGRGGPPARGGGNTHKFYASLGPTIESRQIQITIQGQTISSNFGTIDSARYNLEQLLTAGLENRIMDNPDKLLGPNERALIESLSELSYQAYSNFKSHPCFMPYLEKMSTLKYYAETNIGSRPAKRGKGKELKFEDLRAIPFVGAWSQLKQNVPGYYGMGYAFESMEKQGRLGELQQLYRSSLFFRTLLDNSMQSLSKTNFDLTRYMANDDEFGAFWQDLHDEAVRARHYLILISGQPRLLESNPAIRRSIALREQIVLPLLVVQQYALIKVKQLESNGNQVNKTHLDTYKKLIVRSLYGNINASRNSA